MASNTSSSNRSLLRANNQSNVEKKSDAKAYRSGGVGGGGVVGRAQALRAAFKTWDGGAATVSWNDANNWNSNGLPSVSDDGILLDNSSVGTLPASMTVSNLDMTVKTIQINTTNSFSVGSIATGSSSNASDWIINGDGTAANTLFSMSGTSTGTVTFNDLTGAATRPISIALGGSGTIDIANSSGLLVLNTVISGTSRGITKIGSGTLRLGRTNTYTGATVISAGTLDLTASSTFAGVIAGALSIESAGTFIGASNSSVSGAVTLNGGTVNYAGTMASTLNTNGGNWNGAGSVTGLTTVSAGTLTIGSAGNLTANGNLNVSGTGRIASAAGTSTITGTVNYTSSTNSTFNGVIAGASKILTLNNASTNLVLGGVNTYTGATNISAGTLTLDGSIASGSTVNVLTAGTLMGSGTVNGNATIAGSGVINFGSGATIGGTLTSTGGSWSGLGSVTGAVNVNSGTFTINGALGGGGTLALASGASLAGVGSFNQSFTLAGSNTISSATTLTTSGTSTTNGTATISTGTLSTTGDTIAATGNLTVNGTLGGTGSVSLAGTLGGTGTVNKSVSTSASTGTINFGVGGNITGALTAGNGGTWSGVGSVAGLSTLSAGTFTVSGTMTDSGGMSITGGTLAGAGTVSGIASISSGSINLTSPGNITGALTATGGSWTGTGSAGSVTLNSGTFTVTGNLTTAGGLSIGGGTLDGTGTVTANASLASGAINFGAGGNITGTLGATGGNWNGAGSVGGDVNVTSNTLTIGSGANLTTGGTLNVTGSAAIVAGATSTITGNVNYASSASDTFAGVIAGAGKSVTLNSTGTVLVLSGTNTYTGATMISSGTLRTAGGTALLDSATVSLANSASAVFDLDNTNETIGGLAGGGASGGNVTLGSATLTLAGTGATSYGGAIDGTGAIVKSGTGTQTFTGASIYSGGTTISAGTFLVSNTSGSGTGSGAVVVNGGTLGGTGSIAGSVTVNTGAHLAPGASAGTLTLDALTLSSGAVLDYELGTSIDSTVVSSASGLTLDSGSNTITLNISALSGFGAGTFTILDYNTAFGGSLGSIFLGSAPSGFDYSIVNNTTTTSIDLLIALQARSWAVDADGSWTTGANWTGGTDPNGQGASAYFGSIIGALRTVTLDANRTVNTMTFDSGFAYTISGANTLHFDAASGNAFIFDNNGDHTIAAAVALDKSVEVTVANGGETLTISGNMSGGGAVILSGAGNLLLSGTNTYTGGTTVSGGILRGAAPSIQGNIANESLVIFDQPTNGTYAGVMSGTGALAKINSGTLLLTGANNYTGGTIITAGILQGNSTSIQGDISNDGSVVFDQSAAGTYAGYMTGSGSLVKSNSGTLTLTGPNDYTGGTTVSGGTLRGSATSVQGDIVNNAIVNFDQAIDGTYFGSMSGTGSLLKTGAGKLIVGGTNNYSGGTTVSAGTLQGNTTGLQGNIVNNAAVIFTGGGTQTYSGNMSGSGSLGVAVSGTLLLSGANNYTGGTTVSAGTLTLQGSASSLQGNILNNAAVTFEQVLNGTYAGNMSGTGSLTKVGIGSLLLTGVNNYSGGTTVSSGTLQGTSSSIQGNIANNTSVVFDQTTSGTYAGVMSGIGSITKSNTGTLVLTGASNYSGGTVVLGGTLLVNNTSGSGTGAGAVAVNTGTIGGTGTIAGSVSLTSGTHLAPGASAGTLTVGGLTLGAGTIADYELASPAASDKTVVTTASGLTISGTTLNVTALGGFGTGTYTIFDYDTSFGGSLGNLTLGVHPTGFFYSIVDNTTNTTIDLQVTQFAGPPQWGVNASGNWSTTTNWLAELVPSGAGAMAEFLGVITTPQTVTLDGARTVGTVNFNNTTAAYTLAGSALHIDTISGNGAINDLGGNHLISAPVTLHKNTDVSISGASDTLTMSGVISGAFSLSKAGAGILLLTGANNYSGGTTVNVGVLQGNTTSLQGNIIDNANVTFDQSAAGTYAGVMSGTGSLTKSNTGTLTLTGANNYSGGTTVSGGTLRGTTTSIQGNIVNNANVTFDQSANDTYAGAMSGTGSFTKLNTGILTLTGANNYSGGTTVTGGTIQGAAPSIQGNITNNSAVVFNQLANGTYAGNMSGTGLVTKLNTGTLFLTGANNYTGGTTVTAGTLQGAAPSIQGAITNNSAVIFDQASTGTYGGAMTGTGSLTKIGVGTLIMTGNNNYSGGTTVSAGILQGNTTSLKNNITDLANVTFDQSANGTYAGVISGIGSFTKLNTGTLTLTGANNYTGGTTITGGVLLGASTTIPGNVTDNATLNLSDATAATFAGVISGTGALVKSGAGTLSLTGLNNYSGGTTVSAGVLLGTTLTVQGNITDNANVTFDQAVAGTYAGNMSGSGSMTKLGAATLFLTGANNYSGGTTVSTGTLQGAALSIQGAITNNSAVIFDQASTGTYAGVMSGTGSLTKINTGTLIMTGANNYTGGTTVSAGVLQGTTTSLKNNITDLANVTFDQTTNGTYAGVISGTGSLIKSNTGTVTLTGANNYSGGTTVSTGTLSGTTTSLQGDILDLSNVTFDQTTSGTYANVISGTGSVTKSNTGTVILTGANNYSGGTTVSAGVLQGNTTSLQGNITDNANVTFDQGVDGTYAGNMSGSGAMTKLNVGTLFLTGTNAYSGGTTVSAGAIRGNSIGIQGNITNNASVIFDQAALGTYAGVMSGTGSLTKLGGGTLLLNGTNNYTGGTTVSAGILQVNAGSFQGNILNNASVVYSNNNASTYAGVMSGTGNFTKLGSQVLTLTGANNYSGGTTVSTGTLRGTTTSLQGDIVNLATLNFDQTTTGTCASIISGIGNVTKTNTGTVILTGANNYTGGTSVTGGILQGNSTSLQGNITVTGANVTFDQTSSGTYASVMSGTGSLTKIGASTLILTGANNYSGGTTVSAGILQGATSSVQGNITNNANVTFDQPTDGTYAGVMSGTGSLTKLNAGTLFLTGANNYSGGTTVSVGALRGNATGIQGNITNNTSVIFDQSGTGTYAGVMSGPGSLTKLGAGTLRLTGANNYSGGATISTGTLSGTTTSLQGNILDLSVLNFDQTTTGTYANVISGTGSVTKTNTGTVILTGANNYSGGTTVTGGVLQGSTTSLQGNITNNANVTFDQTSSGTYASVMSGTGSLTKIGANTLILTGANNYSGGTTVSAGTLQGDSTSLQGAITNNATVAFNQTSAGTYSGVMSGSGSFTKTGTGALTITAANSYSGGTTVSNGTLLVNNVTGSGVGGGNVVVNSGATLGGNGTISGTIVVNSGGHVSPGASIGTLHAGGATLLSGSILDFELGAPTSGDVLDITSANGLTILGGAVNLLNAGGMGAGQYKLIDYVTAFNGSMGSLGTPVGPVTFDYALVDNTTNTSIDVVVTPGSRSWAVDASGNWSTGGNWSNGSQPNTAGAVANFTSAASTVNPTVTLDDANKTVGTVNFVNATRSYTIAGTNSLVMDTVTGDAAINVTSGSHAISAPMTLNKNTVATVTNGGDTFSVSGVISGGSSLAKAGAGTLTLTGANNYSGGTTVSAGTLRVNNTTGSGTGSGAVAVNAGTIGGTGTISGAVTIASGATLAPGNSIGTLTVGSLTLSSGSLLAYELAASPSGDDTVITSAGGLALNGGTFTFTDGGINAGSYTLLDYNTSYTGLLGNLAISGSPPSGLNWSLVDNTTNTSIDLVVVPNGPNEWKDLDGSWGTTSNWTNAIVPNAVDGAALFGTQATAPRTVTVEAAKTVGTITFNNASAYTINGAAAVHMNSATAGLVTTTLGSHVINAPVILDSNTTFATATGTSLKLASLTATGRNVIKSGAGALEVNKINGNDLNVTGGSITMTESVGVPNAEVGQPGNGTSVSSLAMSGNSSIDLKNNNMIIRATDFADGNAKYAAAEALVKTGFGTTGFGDTFDWNGTGIRSSDAAFYAQIDVSRMIGILNNNEFGYTEVEGDPVGPSDVIIKYTWNGDATCNGVVDPDDFNQFVFGFNGGPAEWLNGDFDYNGTVDPDDFNAFIAGFNAFNASGGIQLSDSFRAELADFASANGIPLVLDPGAVPEPSSIGAIGLVGVGVLARRRRRS